MIFEGLGLPAILFDGNGDIVNMNCKAMMLLGNEYQQTYDFDMDYDDQGFLNWLRGTVVGISGSGKNKLIINKKINRNGEKKLFKIRISLIEEPISRFKGYVAIFSDVTEFRKAIGVIKDHEEELRCSNDELQNFIYAASHDLREPLRMVNSFLTLLKEHLQDKLDEDAERFIYYAVDGSYRMNKLLDGLLAYSRVSTHAKPLIMIDMNQILDEVKLDMNEAVSQSGASIQCTELPSLCVDPVQMAQVFQNLILNAIKFRSDKKPEICISADKTDEKWLISVKDNGIGIEPDFYEKVFDIFRRLHPIGEYEGAGIGLAICKRIIERHGGTIWVESNQDEGSTFFFTLPIDQAKSPKFQYEGLTDSDE